MLIKCSDGAVLCWFECKKQITKMTKNGETDMKRKTTENLAEQKTIHLLEPKNLKLTKECTVNVIFYT